MMGIKNVLRSGVKNASRHAADRMFAGGLYRRFKVKYRKFYWTAVAVVIYVLFLVAVHHGQNASYTALHISTSGGTSLHSAYGDAKEHKAYLEQEDIELTSDNSIYMDNKTVERILDAVAQYNDDVSMLARVSYECMSYSGRVTSLDTVTGDVCLEPLVGTVTEVVEEPVYDLVSVQDESVRPYIINGIFIDADGDGYISIYNGTREVERIVEVDIEVAETSFWDEVLINRMVVDADSAHFGEDVFYLRWQPVLTLCSMFIQSNVDNYGTYGELDADGESYYLSNEDLQNIINVFAFNYSFYDDVAASNKTQIPFSRMKTESSGYRLWTSIDEEDIDGAIAEGNITSLTVKRIPALAPKSIFNSYLTYTYEYELLDNGYYRLASRECKLDPNNFLAACSELIEDFDGELFIELLADLEDTQDLVDYYGELIKGQEQTYRTYDSAECPAIDTYVSTVTGFTAWLFDRNSASESITDNQSGVIIPEHNFEIPEEALDDAEFLAMFEAAERCLGTEYVFGGNGGPGVSFDCSSFVSYVLRQCGYPVGRETTTSLLAYCAQIAEDEVRPGDIIFFQGTYRRGVSHVGIWLGDNQFIHASSGAGEVVISDYTESSYYREHFLCFSRLPAKVDTE